MARTDSSATVSASTTPMEGTGAVPPVAPMVGTGAVPPVAPMVGTGAVLPPGDTSQVKVWDDGRKTLPPDATFLVLPGQPGRYQVFAVSNVTDKARIIGRTNVAPNALDSEHGVCWLREAFVDKEGTVVEGTGIYRACKLTASGAPHGQTVGAVIRAIRDDGGTTQSERKGPRTNAAATAAALAGLGVDAGSLLGDLDLPTIDLPEEETDSGFVPTAAQRQEAFKTCAAGYKRLLALVQTNPSGAHRLGCDPAIVASIYHDSQAFFAETALAVASHFEAANPVYSNLHPHRGGKVLGGGNEKRQPFTYAWK